MEHKSACPGSPCAASHHSRAVHEAPSPNLPAIKKLSLGAAESVYSGDVPSNKVGLQHITHVCALSDSESKIDFSVIKQLCGSEVLDPSYDLSPSVFQPNRVLTWPRVNHDGMGIAMSHIYTTVVATDLPNFIGAQVPLPTNLNVPVWEASLTQSADDRELLDMIKYGFPLGNMGPPSHVTGVPNHPSATNFAQHIDAFISKELDLRGIIGPMKEPPFIEWAHMSPVMSRPKRGSSSRLIIIDMTYPKELSVNAYIYQKIHRWAYSEITCSPPSMISSQLSIKWEMIYICLAWM